MQKITPFLWFDNNAEEAIRFYTEVFKDSKIMQINRWGAGMPGPEGSVMTASFTLNGQEFVALNGGPQFKFTEAISFVVSCDTQEEIDYYWERLTADGGAESMCGWLKDKFGLSWQIVPPNLPELLRGKDADQSQRTMGALMQMKKLDIAALTNA